MRGHARRWAVGLAMGVVVLVGVGLVGAASWLGAPSTPPSSASRPDARLAPPRPYRGVLLVGTSVGAMGAGRARIERVVLDGSGVEVERLEPPGADVVHAVRCDARGDDDGLLAATGGHARIERWRHGLDGRWASEVWYEARFGLSSRVRDLEVGPLLVAGERVEAVAFGTHDEGVVGTLPVADGTGGAARELDRAPRTLIHEIELGDLDGDGSLEIYATRSPPNTLVPGIEQPGEVVRYDLARGASRELVVDLAPRHAKEILATDLDGDGRDELYVVVEALTRNDEGTPRIVEPVEVRRISSSQPAPGEVIATFPDRFTRFLTAGDIDGDRRPELVAATFSAGLWVLRPGAEHAAPFTAELIDGGSSGYEHAITLADLDRDGAAEVYAADDPSGELRRYVHGPGGWQREVLLAHPGESILTWSLAACTE